MTRKKIDWDAFILIGPVLVLFATGVLYPVLSTFRYSFYKWKGLGLPEFRGLGNYIDLFQDVNFLNSLKITVVWTIASTLLSVLLGWAIALLCGLIPKRSTPYRVAIFMAYGISAVVSGVMWLGIYQPDSGLLNGLLRAVGLDGWARGWLGNPKMALWAVMAAFIWVQTGLPLLNCYASVRSIPTYLYEAATIDGAGVTGMLRYIMIPLSLPGVRVSIFINMLNSLKAFDIIHILTSGGPTRSTETLGYFMYQESVVYFKQGYGAAATVVLVAFVLCISIPLIRDRSGKV